MCVRIGACGSVYWHAGTPHFNVLPLLLCLLLLLLLLPYDVVRITPSLELSSSLLYGSHGTTAVAQQVDVGHYLLCVWCQAKACGVCATILVRVCRCVRVFALCAGTPNKFQLFDICVYSDLTLLLPNINSSAPQRASSSQTLYFVAATLQR